jgi:hypothetical protein
MRSRALSDRARGRRWRWFRRLVIVGLAAVRSSPAHAQVPSEGYFIALGAAASIIPSETGLLVTDDGPRFVLGWSLGVPVADKHHIVGGFNWVPDGGRHDVEGRLGYRYAPGRAFVGFGVALDPAGPTWSPEIGFNFIPWRGIDDADNAGVHLLIRAEIAPELNQVRGATVLLGWTIL